MLYLNCFKWFSGLNRHQHKTYFAKRIEIMLKEDILKHPKTLLNILEAFKSS